MKVVRNVPADYVTEGVLDSLSSKAQEGYSEKELRDEANARLGSTNSLHPRYQDRLNDIFKKATH